MLAKQMTDDHGRETSIALWLVILGALIYGFTVFQYDYFRVLKRGENGQAAIQMLDRMRRPFLALKQAELRLLQSAGEAAAVSGIESAIQDGRQKLSEYLELASYNEEVRKQVVSLEASYEAWRSLELELVRRGASLAADPGNGTEHRELDLLVHRNSAAFLAVMDVLGDGEKPIHHDIDAGAAAVRGLLASSLTFIAYLIAVAFWREWAKRKQERLRYESDLRLHRLAHRDNLTDLANRVLLEDRFSVAIAAARRYGHRVGILYLDLDGFKEVNDEMGHEAGDSVLKEVALRLQKGVRELDTVARVGGDEFVVLTPNLRDTADARVVADKLQAALNQPFELRGKPYSLRASMGIAIFPDNGEQPAQLLQHADAAMYETKRMAKLNAAQHSVLNNAA
ncbi:MAG: GGDEF domain-containing protein [Burkholderiales bacterium]|nr:GGDEF domain-containing protein [Burkholderiales bacterium]